MDEVTDNSDDRRKPWGCVTVVVILFPILYVLSMGPAGRIYEFAPPAIKKVIEVVYLPVSILVESAGLEDLFMTMMEPYFEWWLD